MGIITLALIANGNIAADNFHVPTWVVFSAATAIALGTYAGGWRIIRTLGTRIIKMDPAQGFAAQGAGATVILASSHFGYPLSTTHTISGAIMGAGAAKRLSAVRWGVAGNIVTAWVLTIPAAGAIGGDRLRRHAHLRHRRAWADDRLGARDRPDRRDLRPATPAQAAPPPVPAGSASRRRDRRDGRRLGGAADVVVASLVAAVGRHDRVLARDLRGDALRRHAARRARAAEVVGLRGAVGGSDLAVTAAAVVLGLIVMLSK